MKTFKNLVLTFWHLSFIFYFIICSSCSKKTLEIPPNAKHKINEISDDFENVKIKFDSINNYFSVSNYRYSITSPEYNKGNGRLIKYGKFKTFEYDSKSRLSKFDNISIEYDSNNRIIKLTEINQKYEQYFRFEYDLNSNINKIITTEQYYGLTGKEITLFTAEYDNVVNPYLEIPIENKIFLLSSGFFASGRSDNYSPLFLFSTNNFTKATLNDQVQDLPSDITTQQITSVVNGKPTSLIRLSTINNQIHIDSVKVKYYE